jgi:lysophospholipase L1-like esterase
MPQPTDTSLTAPVEGPSVLRTRTAWTLLWFWVLVGALVVIPSPLRQLLRRAAPATGTIATPAPGVPTEVVRLAGLPRGGTSGVVAIEDPHGGMAPFYRALARTAAKQRGAVTRVLHYGDSLIDQDLITSDLRRSLQKRYGDAGHGFVLAARAWRWYSHPGIVHGGGSEAAWDYFRLVGGRARDGRLGLGCAAIESRGGTASTQVTATEAVRASAVEVHYLRAPAAGRLEVHVDGKHVVTLDAASSRPAGGFHRLQLADAPHRFRLVALGRVRVFGIVLERDGPGITWENLALISARFHMLTLLDAAHWSEQLQQRRPDLVVLQFGANDSISYGGDLERYGDRVLQALRTLRRATPRSACLVIGPLDRAERGPDGHLRSPAVVQRVARKQREVALAARCAFWDAQEAMGGPGAMAEWLRRGLAVRDLVHLSARGSREVAALLERALDEGFRARGVPRGAGSPPDETGLGRGKLSGGLGDAVQ